MTGGSSWWRLWTVAGLLTACPAGAAAAVARAAAADAGCFLEEVWSWDELTLTAEVPFGSAYNPVTRQNETLILDLATPADVDDPLLRRPAFLCVHGGGWTYGDRNSGCGRGVRGFLVKRGFVAASIEYRLTGNYGRPGGLARYGAGGSSWTKKMFLPARDAGHDAKAALRYLRRHARELRVDPERIAAIGTSAGAITSLFLGYTGLSEGRSGNEGFSSEVQAVVSIAGMFQAQTCHSFEGVDGLPSDCEKHPLRWRLHQVDGRVKPPQPPLFLVHGTEDTVVLPNYSTMLYNRAQATGLKSDFVLMEGEGHSPNFVPEHGPRLARFLYEALNLKDAMCPRRASGSGRNGRQSHEHGEL